MASSKCNVCMEEFTKEGESCPKLLPCTHTVCLWCLNRLRGNRIKCPECREAHQKPNGGPKGFPTNRYVLEILDLIKASVEQKPQPKKAEPKEEPILCEDHQKPCVMFCLEKECWKLLCPKCPLQQHQEHDVVSFVECLDDFDQLKQMKQAVVDELSSLNTYDSGVTGSLYAVSRENEQAQKAIDKKAKELKQAIDRNAEELKRNIQQQSNEQVKKLEAILSNVYTQSSVGKQLKHDIENRPRKGVSQAIRHLAKLNKKFLDFTQSSNEERSKEVSYDVLHFKTAESQGLTSDCLGEIQITKQSLLQSHGFVAERPLPIVPLMGNYAPLSPTTDVITYTDEDEHSDSDEDEHSDTDLSDFL